MTLPSGRKPCPVCGDEMAPARNVYETDNGYVYARDLDECFRCRRHFVSGLRRFVEYLSDVVTAGNEIR